MKVPFNKPFRSGKESEYVLQAIESGDHSGNHSFGQQVAAMIRKKYQNSGVFLTPSCSSALEMGIVLADLQPGDEVIMPSFTFSSTANAVMLFGGKPVFCEISPETMNIDVSKIEKLITPRTKMIIPIDYAGIPCDMGPIIEVADRHDLIVMLDAAQSFGSYYQGEPTGIRCHMVCFSFHETKNYSCGEGGALIVNKGEWLERASYVQEKGTDRTKFLAGKKERYSWVEKGSSYLLSDILAAMLLAQLEEEEQIKKKRRKVDAAYRKILQPWAAKGKIGIPRYPADRESNYHAFWVIFDQEERKEAFITKMEQKNIAAYIGYVPLHSAKMGYSLGYKSHDLPITESMASRLVRLPMFPDLSGSELEYCCREIEKFLNLCFTSKEIHHL